jgi:hypothetical protein
MHLLTNSHVSNRSAEYFDIQYFDSGIALIGHSNQRSGYASEIVTNPLTDD